MHLLTTLWTFLTLAPSPSLHIPKATYTYGEQIKLEVRNIVPGTTGYINLEYQFEGLWSIADMDIACLADNAVSPKAALKDGVRSYNTRLLEKIYVERGAATVRFTVVYCTDLHTCTTTYRSAPFQIKK